MTVKTLNRPFTAEIDTRATDTGNVLSFVATTAGVKRDGLDINIAGLSTENFMRNPVFLWAHDYMGDRLPIGRVTSIRKQKTKVKVRVEFDEEDDFAMSVKSKFDRGFLNTVSIGWETVEFDRDTNTVVASDLLDVSAVPVPGDPDALIERQKVALRSLGQDLLDRFDYEVCAIESAEGFRCLEGQAGHEGACNYEATVTGDTQTITPFREIAPDGGWRQYESANTNVTVNGTITNEQSEAFIRAVNEHLGIIGAVCPDCGISIAERYKTVNEDGVAVAYCEDCADEISGEQTSIDNQEGEQMERLERVVTALDEFRSALSDLIDNADDTDDKSMEALLEAFTDDTTEGDED